MSGSTLAKSSGDHTPLGGFVSHRPVEKQETYEAIHKLVELSR